VHGFFVIHRCLQMKFIELCHGCVPLVIEDVSREGGGGGCGVEGLLLELVRRQQANGDM
jgi:hypothetical protein